MIIYPAIDLKNGQCVRLCQGRAEDAVVYGADPVEMARRWTGEGAEFLHLVDLDGAFRGEPAHTAVVSAIARSVKVPVQVGGGLRDREDVARLVDAGVRRVIFGSRAVSRPDLIEALVGEFGDRIVVGIDAREGRVQVRGWLETTAVTVTDLARRMEALGVRTIIYTDTARDGMLHGVNVEGVRALCGAVRCGIVASGGVASEADVRALAALGLDNLDGAIVGKALYEGRATLAGLRAAARSG